MKILVVTGTIPPYRCGVGDYTDRLCQSMTENGMQIDVLTSMRADSSKVYKVYPYIKDWDDFTTFSKFRRVCDETKPDIIHFQMPTTEYKKGRVINLLIVFSKLLGYKTVITLHEYTESSLGYRLKLALPLKVVDKVIIVDRNFKRALINRGVRLKKIDFINIGSSISTQKLTSEIVQVNKARFDDTKSKMIIGSFGFVSQQKCFDLIIETVKELKDNAELRSKFVIISELSDENEYQRNIKQLIEKNGLQDDFYITGFQEEKIVGELLASCDCACMLFKNGVSDRNSSVVAAIAQGLDIITSRPNGEFSYSNNCIFVDNNSASLSSAIIERQNAYFGGQISSSKDSLIAELDWNTIADRHKKIYANLVKG